MTSKQADATKTATDCNGGALDGAVVARYI
jgi:hypothetical protein